MKRVKENSGFTLIEVLVASTIVIVLMTIGMVSYTNASKKSRDNKRKADLEIIRQGLVLMRADEGSYPDVSSHTITSDTSYTSTLNVGGTTVSTYLSQPYPLDPQNPTLSYSYTTSDSGASFELSATMEVSEPNPYIVYSP